MVDGYEINVSKRLVIPARNRLLTEKRTQSCTYNEALLEGVVTEMVAKRTLAPKCQI